MCLCLCCLVLAQIYKLHWTKKSFMCLSAEKFSLSPNLLVFCWPCWCTTFNFTLQMLGPIQTEGLEVLQNTGVRICLETDFHFKQVFDKKFLIQRHVAGTGDNIFKPTLGLFERKLLSNQIEQDAVVDWDKNLIKRLKTTRLTKHNIPNKCE